MYSISDINRIWVKSNFTSQTIRSLLSSDIAITTQYKYGDYDNIVDAVNDSIGNGRLYRVEYKGNSIGFFIWSGGLKKYFFKPEVRNSNWKTMLEKTLSTTATNQDTQIKIPSTTTITVTLNNYQNII